MLADQQFQMLITSTDTMTMQINYQRVVQQLKIWKTDYKNLHQDNIKLYEDNQLLRRQLTKKNQYINELSKDIIKLTKLIIQNDQSVSDAQLVLKEVQNQVKAKELQIQTLKRNLIPQKKKNSSLQDALKEASESLQKARKQLQRQSQKSLKLTEELATLRKADEQKKIQIEKLKHSLQFQKRKIIKYEKQIALLNQQVDKKDINIGKLSQQLSKVKALIQQQEKQNLKKEKQHLEIICGLNYQLKMLKNEAETLRIQRKTSEAQTKKQVEKNNLQVTKQNQQLKNKVQKLEQKISSLQIRCIDQSELSKQLQQLLKTSEKQCQQFKMNEAYMRKQVKQQREKLNCKAQISLHQLKAGIQTYFETLNKNLAGDNEMKYYQNAEVIETQRQQLQQVLNNFGKLSK